MSDSLTFAACTFTRVFDTEPLQDVLTLEELTGALTRFELKPKLLAQVQRGVRRAEAAWAAWQAGETSQGRSWSRLERAANEARKAGEDVDEAVRAAFEKLLVDTRKWPKREMRLWSPAFFAPGARRETEGVVHLSSLVLDYDSGFPIDEASALWSPWYHVLHTTWSHTPELPKFRVVLPLLDPVRVEDWAAVYEWALARSEGADPSGKSAGGTFALPVVPNREWPRMARVCRAPLLDPVGEGLVEDPAPSVEIPRLPSSEAFLRVDDPEYDFIPSEASLAEAPEEGPARDDDLWDAWGDVGASSAPATPEVDGLLSRLEAVLDRLEGDRDATFVDALERLVALYDSGALSDDEFQVAKARLLRGS